MKKIMKYLFGAAICFALSLALVQAFYTDGLTSSKNAAAAAEGQIYYYVDCGSTASGLSQTETQLGASMGVGQTAKDAQKTAENDWGYTQGVSDASAEGGAFDTFVRGNTVAYTFTLDGAAKDYQISLGYQVFAGGTVDSIKIGGAEKLEAPVTAPGKQIAVYDNQNLSGALTVEIGGTDAALAFIVISQPSADMTVGADYDGHIAVVLAEAVDFKATCYTTLGIVQKPIVYTNFNVNSLNKLYETQRIEGKIDGTALPVSQYVFVVPKDLQYFVNAGANLTNDDYVNGSEGVLGKELDPTGLSGAGEPYYNAVKKRVPTLKNELPTKQNTDSTWGYMGNQQIAGIRTTANAKTVFESIMFPKRGTTDCDFSLQLDAGKYDIHVGTYSYWFARKVDILVDEKVAVPQYEIRPANAVVTIEDVTLAEAKQLAVKIKGAKMYDEAMVSFVAVVKADDAEYPDLAAPAAPETVDFDATEFTVTGLTAGAKMQVSNAANNCLLYEKTVAAGETSAVVDITGAQYDRVTAYNVGLVNYAKASAKITVQKTDIKDMSVTMSEAWTAKQLPLKITAASASKLTSAVVAKEGGETVTTVFDTPKQDLDFTFGLTDNGVYTVTLYSGLGCTAYKTVTVSNIDKTIPTLAVSIDKSKSTAAAMTVALDVSTYSPVTKLYYIDQAGVTTQLDPAAKSVSLSQSGRYTFFAQNAVTKVASASAQISVGGLSLKTLSLSYDKSAAKQTDITFLPASGFEKQTINCWLKNGAAFEKMIVNQNVMTVFDNGEYFVEYISTDGTTEFFTFTVDNLVKKVGTDGLSTGAGVGIGLGIAIPVCAVGVFLFIKFYLTKKPKGDTHE